MREYSKLVNKYITGLLNSSIYLENFKKIIMKNSNLISVIISVFNGENSIEESLQSIQQQSYKNLEILVLDDGSTDSTYKILNG